MNTRIQKWGNSLAVRLPRAFTEEIGLAENSSVEVHIEDGKIVLTPQTAPAYRLEDLLAQVSEANIHGELESGTSVGNEEW